ncbi:MAG: TonB family protein [Burkholderiaceae bacterium]
MDASRLSAAGGALALHGLVLTGVLTLAIAPATKRTVEPVQVVLLTAPEPLPVARASAPPAAEPTAGPPARSAPLEAAAPRPAPQPVRARPRPRPEPRPMLERPAQPPVSARPEAPAPVPDLPVRAAPPQSSAITVPPPVTTTEPAPGQDAGPPGAPASPATALDAAAGSRRGDGIASAAPSTRSAPHVDATWSGNTPPPYPGMARRLGDQGEVRLDVHVGADGRVTEVRLKQSSGSTLLDRTAIDTVRKWRFKPATVDGRPVAEWYHDWRWVFRLEG